MAGQVLLGSGDDKIPVDVVATAWKNDVGMSGKPEFSYSYNGEDVRTPEHLYDAVKRQRERK